MIKSIIIDGRQYKYSTKIQLFEIFEKYPYISVDKNLWVGFENNAEITGNFKTEDYFLAIGNFKAAGKFHTQGGFIAKEDFRADENFLTEEEFIAERDFLAAGDFHAKENFHAEGIFQVKKDFQTEGNFRAYPKFVALENCKVKNCVWFSNLYKYPSGGYYNINKKENVIMLGCYIRTQSEWESDFYNNPGEFPEDENNKDTKKRLFALSFIIEVLNKLTKCD